MQFKVFHLHCGIAGSTYRVGKRNATGTRLFLIQKAVFSIAKELTQSYICHYNKAANNGS